VSRYALTGLRLLASLAAGAAAWTTFWVIRGGEPGAAAYVASLAASLAVYVASASPPPRPWEMPPEEGDAIAAEKAKGQDPVS
jgi:hypothetical protein